MLERKSEHCRARKTKLLRAIDCAGISLGGEGVVEPQGIRATQS